MKKIFTLCAVLMALTATSAQAHVTIRNFANGLDSMSGKSDHFRLNMCPLTVAKPLLL